MRAVGSSRAPQQFVLTIALLLLAPLARTLQNNEEDWYKILGVTKVSTNNEVRSAYKKCVNLSGLLPRLFAWRDTTLHGIMMRYLARGQHPLSLQLERECLLLLKQYVYGLTQSASHARLRRQFYALPMQ